MAAEKESEASLLVSMCRFFMKEVGMPNTALQESLSRVSATPTNEPKSAKYLKSVTADFYVVEDKNAIGPSNPNLKKLAIIIKPQIPDLNKPAPEIEGFMEDHAKVVEVEVEVEVEAEATTTSGKRKITEASVSGVKRFKGTAVSASPANNDKGKEIIEIEDSEDEE